MDGMFVYNYFLSIDNCYTKRFESIRLIFQTHVKMSADENEKLCLNMLSFLWFE